MTPDALLRIRPYDGAADTRTAPADSGPPPVARPPAPVDAEAAIARHLEGEVTVWSRRIREA